jgi:hypothetical protein
MLLSYGDQPEKSDKPAISLRTKPERPMTPDEQARYDARRAERKKKRQERLHGPGNF